MATLKYEKPLPNQADWAQAAFELGFNYACNRLNLPKDIQIDVSFDPSKTYNWAGTYSNYSPTQRLYINLVPNPVLTMIQIMFHELKHVEQYATSKLVHADRKWYDPLNTTRIIYAGSTYVVRRDDLDPTKSDPEAYAQLPWEREAFQFESEQYRNFAIDVDPLLWSMLFIDQYELIKQAA